MGKYTSRMDGMHKAMCFSSQAFRCARNKEQPFLVTVSFLVSMKGSSLGTVSPYVVYNLKSIGKHIHRKRQFWRWFSFSKVGYVSVPWRVSSPCLPIHIMFWWTFKLQRAPGCWSWYWPWRPSHFDYCPACGVGERIFFLGTSRVPWNCLMHCCCCCSCCGCGCAGAGADANAGAGAKKRIEWLNFQLPTSHQLPAGGCVHHPTKILVEIGIVARPPPSFQNHQKLCGRAALQNETKETWNNAHSPACSDHKFCTIFDYVTTSQYHHLRIPTGVIFFWGYPNLGIRIH